MHINSDKLRFSLLRCFWTGVPALKPHSFATLQSNAAAQSNLYLAPFPLEMAMVEEDTVGEFADRLKHEFEDRISDGSDMGESQDWFVNDKREDERAPSPTCPAKDQQDVTNTISSPTLKPPISPSPSNTAETAEEDLDDGIKSTKRTAFLHYIPPASGILVMELGTSDQVMQRRYGSRFFKIYIPQVHDSQTDFCLFARKRLNKHKFRFSLDEFAMSKWNNPCYGGKVVMAPTPKAKRYKLVVPKNASRVTFDIEQEARKQELIVRLNSQAKRFQLFRSRSSTSETPGDTFRSLIQKFINPIADVRCPKSNSTLFKIEKEGDAGSEKFIVTYARPFSLFVSCCIAVAVEGHQLE